MTVKQTFNYSRPYTMDEVDYIIIQDNCMPDGDFYEDNRDFRDELAFVSKVNPLRKSEKREIVQKALKLARQRVVGREPHQSEIDLEVLQYLQKTIERSIDDQKGLRKAKQLRNWFGSIINFFDRELGPYIMNFDTVFDDDLQAHTVDEYPSPLASLT